MALQYPDGQTILAGDRLQYRGEPAIVDFVVFELGDPTRDSYLEDFPCGGAMLSTERIGSVFVPTEQFEEEHLLFVARSG